MLGERRALDDDARPATLAGRRRRALLAFSSGPARARVHPSSVHHRILSRSSSKCGSASKCARSLRARHFKISFGPYTPRGTLRSAYTATLRPIIAPGSVTAWQPSCEWSPIAAPSLRVPRSYLAPPRSSAAREPGRRPRFAVRAPATVAEHGE